MTVILFWITLAPVFFAYILFPVLVLPPRLAIATSPQERLDHASVELDNWRL
jgi:hypothetical protein